MARRFYTFLFLVAVCLFGTLFASPAQAKWPSWEDVLNDIAPILGLDGDQLEATKFSINNPSCSGTIVSYTAAQDYSLVGFIGVLKTTKMQSIPQILPINGGNCKQMQPVRMAYEFVDKKGDEYLGKDKADFFRNLLADAIKEGKGAIDEQIAAIPYVGTIITNWDCECDAAFQTNFPSEKIVDQKVGQAVGIIKSVKNGSYGNAVGKLLDAVGASDKGAKAVCELAESYAGVGGVPIVSDVAAKVCGKIASKAIGWVVSGAGDIAQFVGLIGGEHIPFEQYYAQMFTPELAKDGYAELADILYNKCYNYYEPTNLSADNSKEVCGILRNRYLTESRGKEQNEQAYWDIQDFIKKNVDPKAHGAVMKTDADFVKDKTEMSDMCMAYFPSKYPDIWTYMHNYGGTDTGSAQEYWKQSCNYNDRMDYKRTDAQKSFLFEVEQKTSPLCIPPTVSGGGQYEYVRNLLKCVDGPGLDLCKQSLSFACSTSSQGGKERPCCEGGGKLDSTLQNNADFAKKLADAAKPFCYVDAKDPLRIVCMTQDSFKSCSNHFQWLNQRECDPKDKGPTGMATQVCCAFDAKGYDDLAGVKEAKTWVDNTNKQKPINSCSVGSNPLAISCSTIEKHDACVSTFGTCGSDIQKPCCMDCIFCGSEKPAQVEYDPYKRSAEDIALAKKIVADSDGGCVFDKTPNGKEDIFHIVCHNKHAMDLCYSQEPIASQRSGCFYTKDGYVYAVCCQKDMSMFTASTKEMREQEQHAGDKGVKNMLDNSASVDGVDTHKPKKENEGGRKPPSETKHRIDKLVSDKHNKLVSIKLLSQKPSTGTSPFDVADIKNLDSEHAPSSLEKPLSDKPVTAPREVAVSPPPASPSRSFGVVPPSPPPPAGGSAAPITTETRAPFTVSRVVPTSFSCSGKADGNYCKDVNTQVFCYHETIANSQNCPSGCDGTKGICNAYKP